MKKKFGPIIDLFLLLNLKIYYSISHYTSDVQPHRVYKNLEYTVEGRVSVPVVFVPFCHLTTQWCVHYNLPNICTPYIQSWFIKTPTQV